MRKLISFILTAAILFSFSALTLPANAVSGEDTDLVTSFEASTFSVLLGKKSKVTFSARINSAKRLSAKDIAVYDDDGNFITYLHDNGKDGDAFAHDGIYSASVELYSNKMKTVKYHASLNGKCSTSHPIKFRSVITDADFYKAYALWNKLEAYENELAKRGMTAEEIASAAYNYLLDTEKSNISSIKRENAKAFSFVLKSGIENYFEHFETTDFTERAETLNEKAKALNYITKNSVGVWCPYYGIDNSFTYSYTERANAMNSIAHFDSIDTYYAADASVESFKNFDKYGIIMIDSHGADYNGGGYICVPRPGEYDKQDIADGHLVLSGSTILLCGSFMQKYCDTLPQSIIYTGICDGMAADNFYAPLLNHGAAFVAGFDNPVSFTFDGIIMNDFCQRLVETNPSTNAQYTVGEAYNACIAINGDIDKYASDGARFVCKGNMDTVASAKAIAVESVSFDTDSITLYHNNEYTLKPIVTPVNANRYIASWTSDNPQIVSVDEKGKLKAYTSDGNAKITCTLTDTADGKEAIYSASINVTVNGYMPVSGISIGQYAVTLYANTQAGAKAQAKVLPENASNQTLLYSSSDETVATVDESGMIMPHKSGTAFIKVTSEDSGDSESIVVNVKEGSTDAALNKANGILAFTQDSNYPAQAVSKDGRYCVQTSNSGAMNSYASITLDAGELDAGTVLCFDWAVSSEVSFDIFKFTVNNAYVCDISGTRTWTTVEYKIPEKGKYIFKWAYTKDYSTDIDFDCGWLDEVDIISPGEMHTVTFVDFDGATVIDAQTVPHGESASVPMLPEHTGCEFIGWSDDFTNVRHDITVKALYRMDSDTCTVTFIGMNGEVICTKTVTVGSAVEPPQPPQTDGYVFLYWDKDLSKIENNTEVHAVYGILGDANHDGVVNTGDATFILKCSAQIVQPDSYQSLLGDFTMDGKLNTGDATAVLRYIVMQ